MIITEIIDERKDNWPQMRRLRRRRFPAFVGVLTNNITTEISAFVDVLNNVIIAEIIDQRKGNSPQMRRSRRHRFWGRRFLIWQNKKENIV